MKASEMTNEELAKALMSRVPLDSDSHDDIREASARLRKQDIIVAAQKAKGAAEGYATGCERVADLSRRLKVAEKALQNLQERLVSSVYDGTLNPHEALEIAENALSAIREEWGEMNSKQSVTNCNRLGNAAKMREALQSLVEYIDRECIPCGENACELLYAAHNALAKAAGESETISQPHRGARRNAETTEATDSTHSAVRKG